MATVPLDSDCTSCGRDGACLIKNLLTRDRKRFIGERQKQQFQKGAIIRIRDRLSGGLCSVCSGRVKVYYSFDDERDLLLRFAGSGSSILETCFPENGSLSCFLSVAEEKTTLCFLSRKKFNIAMSENLLSSVEILQSCGTLLEEYNKTVSLLHQKNADRRILMALLTALDGLDEEIDEKEEIRLSLTHYEIAEMTGLKRNTVSIVMKRFRDENIIESSRGVIRVQPTKLHARLNRRTGQDFF